MQLAAQPSLAIGVNEIPCRSRTIKTLPSPSNVVPSMPGHAGQQALRRLQHDVEPLAEAVDFEAAQLARDRRQSARWLRRPTRRSRLARERSPGRSPERSVAQHQGPRGADRHDGVARSPEPSRPPRSSGTPKTCPAASTVRTWVIITVKGRVKPHDRAALRPARHARPARPAARPWSRTTSMPTPRPDRSVTCGRRRKSGREDQVDDCPRPTCLERRVGYDFALAGDFAHARHVDAAAVILDFDHHLLALARGPQLDRRGRGLAQPRRARLRSPRPWSQAVAQDMQQRLGDRLDDRLVGLRGGAFDHQPCRLAEGGRHLAHEARKALEGVMERQDAQAEHRRAAVRRPAARAADAGS